MKIIDRTLTEFGWFLQHDIEQTKHDFLVNQELGHTIDTAVNQLTLILERHALNRIQKEILRRATSQSQSLISRK